MNKEKIRDVDIFQRTLCCRPMRPIEEETEIFESETEKLQEEEGEFLPEEEKLDMKMLMDEMECMKRRIQMMQLHLKLKMSECPEEPCMEYEVLLNCSNNKEICALQKNQYMLQCQIKELIRCLKVVKGEIHDLHLLMCEKENEILEIRELVKTLIEWKDTLQHEFGKCLERFEYLKHVKAEWSDVNEKIERLQKCVSSLKESFVSQVCFQQEKKSFTTSINQFRQMLNELCQYQVKRFASLESRLQNSQEAEELKKENE